MFENKRISLANTNYDFIRCISSLEEYMYISTTKDVANKENSEQQIKRKI